VSYEAIRLWCNRFGSKYAERLRRKHQGYVDTFFIDEVFVKTQDQRLYLWRAVDQDGEGSVDLESYLIDTRAGHAQVQIDASGTALFRCTCRRLQFVQSWPAFGFCGELSIFPAARFCVLGKCDGDIEKPNPSFFSI
jgi:hypothetical protein